MASFLESRAHFNLIKEMKYIKRLIIVPVVLLVCAVLYYGYFYDKFYTLVQEKFYRSAQLSGTKLQKVIDQYKIRSIINLRGAQDDEVWYQTEKQVAQKNNIALINIPFQSHALPKYLRLNALVTSLVNTDKPVLVHCWRGADRAGMASALALAIEKDLSLIELKKQFSWRYGVFPFRNSIGTLVFSDYEKWLKIASKQHNREQLLYWIRNRYTDPNENLEYYIDKAGDQFFKPAFLSADMIASLPKDKDRFTLNGWAFDAKTRQLPLQFHVNIGKHLSKKVMFEYPRPDVATYLGLNQLHDEPLRLGWSVEINSQSIPKGCHRISMLFLKPLIQKFTIETNYKLCME